MCGFLQSMCASVNDGGRPSVYDLKGVGIQTENAFIENHATYL